MLVVMPRDQLRKLRVHAQPTFARKKHIDAGQTNAPVEGRAMMAVHHFFESCDDRDKRRFLTAC